ncbi:MAG: 4Fe-4S dicluster domain-containing protein [Dactylosporangium sp.]|nr:4Fe-4S dicluster domain-containing protein [Dactylosporangium sp.]
MDNTTQRAAGSAVVVGRAGLQTLVDVLATRGYTVLGPTVRDGAIIHSKITSLDDLPQGWGDTQEAGRYRLRRRGDDALFGFASGAQSAKPTLYPTSVMLGRRSRNGNGAPTSVGTPPADAGESGDGASAGPYALLGVRSCDLHAIGIHDWVLGGRPDAGPDPDYERRRRDLFLVAVTCGDPSGTCFCASMGTGPRPDRGYDLALTELLDDQTHQFLLEPGSPLGANVLAQLPGRPAEDADLAAAHQVAQSAAGRMGRTLDTDGLREILYSAVNSLVWEDIAARCLACENCTMVCPTCFCTSIDDTTDLTGTTTERRRVWDSCFSSAFSGVHGRSIRTTVASRYRQWMTHKLASWIDQFGTSGCVGCGRCITWCPASIDLTAEAANLRAERNGANGAQASRALRRTT